MALALDGHSQHESEGVFAGSGGAGEDEGVGETASGDGGAEMLDCGGVAEEIVEGGGKGYRIAHGLELPLLLGLSRCLGGASTFHPWLDDTSFTRKIRWPGGWWGFDVPGEIQQAMGARRPTERVQLAIRFREGCAAKGCVRPFF